MNAQRCFHCSAGLSGGPVRTVLVDGRPEPVCSDRCAAIVQRIVERGLTRFYAFRTATTPPTGESDADARYGIYDRPGVQKAFVTDAPGGLRRASLVIDGVRCAACSWLIEEALTAVPGVRTISIDPLTARAEVHYDPSRLRLSDVLRHIADLGYRPWPFTSESVEEAIANEQRSAMRRLIVAGLGMMQVGSFAAALYLGAFEGMDAAIENFFRLVSMLVATPVVLYSGAPFFAGALKTLRNRRLGMDVPVSLAIGAAYLASVWNAFTGTGEVYFDSCTMFVFLLSSARFLERAGRHRALNLTRVLASHLPHAATRIRGGNAEEVGVMELEAGDLVLVGAGAVIPADGLLEDASARVDESMVTGESRPVTRQRGAELMAGSLNVGDPVRLRVTRTGAETVMSQISRLVADARASRPPAVELADRRASLFVGVVLAGALVVGAIWLLVEPARAFPAVLAVLVVTCPCALSLATPAAFTVATSALARQGLLVRRGGALTTLASVTDVVLDKTGTLTEHSTSLDGVEVHGRLDAATVLELAALLESHSDHPLARAFPRPDGVAELSDVKVVTGRGLEGVIRGRRHRIGRGDYVAELAGVPAPDDADADDGPQVWLGDETGLLARFVIAERFRRDAALTIAALKELGVRVWLASGDREAAVQRAADRLGIAAARANLLPADKLAFVRGLQARGAIVAMVGDGINDAPVLAGADVSIAVGSGTALAHHAADTVLMTSGLAPIAGAIRAARRTRQVIRQNLAWSAGYNLIALPLAGAGILTPWMAAIGMSLSSLLVTGNALRLSRLALSAPDAAPAADDAPASLRPLPGVR